MGAKLDIFLPATEDEVTLLVAKSPSKPCSVDPVPTWMLKAHLDCLLPIITNLVNESMSTGIVPTKMKAALVTPLLKKPSLDKNVMENFRSISNLSFIGVNRPAIVREIPHFGLVPALPHFCEDVPHFWLYFELTKIAENRNTFSCMYVCMFFCSKKLCENVKDSVTYSY